MIFLMLPEAATRRNSHRGTYSAVERVQLTNVRSLRGPRVHGHDDTTFELERERRCALGKLHLQFTVGIPLVHVKVVRREGSRVGDARQEERPCVKALATVFRRELQMHGVLEVGTAEGRHVALGTYRPAREVHNGAVHGFFCEFGRHELVAPKGPRVKHLFTCIDTGKNLNFSRV